MPYSEMAAHFGKQMLQSSGGRASLPQQDAKSETLPHSDGGQQQHSQNVSAAQNAAQNQSCLLKSGRNQKCMRELRDRAQDLSANSGGGQRRSRKSAHRVKPINERTEYESEPERELLPRRLQQCSQNPAQETGHSNFQEITDQEAGDAKVDVGGHTAILRPFVILLLAIFADQGFEFVQLFFRHGLGFQQVHQQLRGRSAKVLFQQPLYGDLAHLLAAHTRLEEESTAANQMTHQSFLFHDPQQGL